MRVSSLKKKDLSNEIIDKILYEELEDKGDRGKRLLKWRYQLKIFY